MPALTRLKDYPGAVDQYIEVIKAYPEDEGLANEAALYAQQHGQQDRLVGYFTRATTASPRDFRWPLVTARLQSELEQFDAARSDYNQASKLRPERTDLYIAKGALEERQLQLAGAAVTYEKLYDLTYHDPQWLEKAAEDRADSPSAGAIFEVLCGRTPA